MTMNTKEIIQSFIAENFLFSSRGFELGDDESLLAAGVIDSTGVLELVLFVEETFDIQVENHEIIPDNFDSVNNLQRYIERKRNGSGVYPASSPAAAG
jgi:acyl carrier protein